MSAGELGRCYEPGGGYRPRAPAEPLTRRQRIAHWVSWLLFVAWMIFHARFPQAGPWLGLVAVPIFAFFLVRGLAFPRRGISDEEDDWQDRLTPVRRIILLILGALFTASYAAAAIGHLRYDLEPFWNGYLLLAWLVMLGLGSLVWPRDESEIDMRPVWALCALAMAVFFVIITNIL